MQWFEFTQNNSGGSFEVNDKLCHRLFIEAENYENARTLVLALGVYFDGVDAGLDCPCCGDRWSDYEDVVKLPVELGGIFGKKEKVTVTNIEDYAQYLANNYGWTVPDARLYYADHEVLEIYIQKKEK